MLQTFYYLEHFLIDSYVKYIVGVIISLLMKDDIERSGNLPPVNNT